MSGNLGSDLFNLQSRDVGQCTGHHLRIIYLSLLEVVF